MTSTCTVFAESEVTSHVSRGKDPKDILAGLHASIANRTLSLMQRVGIEPENHLHRRRLPERRDGPRARSPPRDPVNVSPLSQYMGALGAALHGQERQAAPRPPARGEPRGGGVS